MIHTCPCGVKIKTAKAPGDMVQCPKCGAESPLIARPPGAVLAGPYRTYAEVPWFRRSSFNSLLCGLGLCIGPLVWWCCIIVLTGDVYYNQYEPDGSLKKWSSANKVAAIIILVLNGLGTFSALSSMTGR